MPNTEACLRSRKDVVIRALCVLDGVRRWSRKEVGWDLERPTHHRKACGFYSNHGSHWFEAGETGFAFMYKQWLWVWCAEWALLELRAEEAGTPP